MPDYVFIDAATGRNKYVVLGAASRYAAKTDFDNIFCRRGKCLTAGQHFGHKIDTLIKNISGQIVDAIEGDPVLEVEVVAINNNRSQIVTDPMSAKKASIPIKKVGYFWPI